MLARTVLTRSDLGGAVIEGADFSDAVIDLPQKQVHSLFILFLVFFFFGCLTM